MKKQDRVEIKNIFNELKKGNNKAIEELFEKYNKIIYGIAFSILKNKDDSEDIVQTVISKLYEIEKDKMPKDKEATWLYTVTKNEALMFLRKKNQSYDIEKIYNLENEKSEINELIDKEDYNNLINKLNTKEKEIVSLKVLSNLSFNQISLILGEPIGTVKWRYYKSIYTLRILLSNLSMFVVTFVLGITAFKQTKKTTDKIVEDETIENEIIQETTTTNDTNLENNKEEFKQDMVNNEIQGTPPIENEETQENIVVEQVTNNNINYFGYGMLSISTIFLVLTIIFTIILRKHQLNSRLKSSK